MKLITSQDRLRQEGQYPHFAPFLRDASFGSGRLSLRAIQQYMGHSSLQTTMVYLHLTEIGCGRCTQGDREECFGE